MKHIMKLQSWMPSLIVGAALAGSAGLCLAQSPVNYTFDSDVQGWKNVGPAATYSWDSNHGVGGSGCLKVVFADLGTNNEADPGVDLSINTADYASVEFDMMIDGSSGQCSDGGTLGLQFYGNLQAIFRDSSMSWDSMWFGPLPDGIAGSYRHYKFSITNPKPEQHLVIQMQAPSGQAYASPVTIYVDNVKITPVNPTLITAFTDSSILAGTLDTAKDAPFVNPITHQTANLTPAGSMKLQVANPGGWSDWNQLGCSFNPSRFEHIGFDLYYDGPDAGGTKYGGVQLLIIKPNWQNVSVGGIAFTAAMIGKWTHFDFPCAASGLTASPALVFQCTPGNGGGEPITFHIDNIVLWTSPVLPKIAGITPADAGGVNIAVNGPGAPYDREALCTPAASSSANLTWGGQTPATYSFTLTNFPAPASAPGLEAHIFIFNGSTFDGNNGSEAWNETYAGADWNAADLAVLRVENASGTNVGVVARFEWKSGITATNSNPTNIVQVGLPGLSSANGTWALNFVSDTSVNVVGPNGSVLTNVTLPASMAANFTAPVLSFLQFGAFKNDGPGTGKNDNKSFTISKILVSNSTGTLFNDDFSAGLTNNYAWRASSALVNWMPQGAAYWLSWTTPDIGFTVQSAPSVTGPWNDAGVTYSYINAAGNKAGAIPTASVPAGNAAFFRLKR